MSWERGRSIKNASLEPSVPWVGTIPKLLCLNHVSVVKGTLSGEYVVLGTFAGTVLVALSAAELLPRQKTLQRNWVSCSFVAVIILYSIDVMPMPVA